MTDAEKERIINKQRAFFRTGATLPVGYRIRALKKLARAIRKYEPEIQAALRMDLGKSGMEAYICEVGLALSEISYMLRHIGRYAAVRRVHTPITNFYAVSRIVPCPYGNVLIMSPWNYPFLLSMAPLINALAAGNTIVLKPSAYSQATSAVMAKMIRETFRSEYVAVFTGGREENQFLLKQKFDYIFFTGSQAVGKEVLRHAAEHLTPVTLELGGKCPCIVDSTAKLKLAARRIVFAKFMNCGQTCVSPDYILCNESVKDEFLVYVKKEIIRQFGRHPLENRDYGKMINKKHYDRICSLIEDDKVVHGGKRDAESLRIEPTVMDDVTWDDPVMGQEIFGPIMPVVTYKNLQEAIDMVEDHAKPLALYIFSTDKGNIKNVTENCRYGGGCINDAVVHIATSEMPFGGVGESGMGAYHGKRGFYTFTHEKSILDKKNWIDMPMRYQPYTKINEKLLRLFLR